MPKYSTVFELSGLDGTNGFRIVGAEQFGHLGYAVTSADLNDDGIADLVISAPYATGDVTKAGTMFVLYGGGGSLGRDVLVSQITGPLGFRIDGETFNDQTGKYLSSAGDLDNDGIEDLLIAAPGGDQNGPLSGKVFVLFGKAGGLSDTHLTALTGANGFQLSGLSILDEVGSSVSSLGDVNGDGIDDLVIGAKGADNRGQDSGSAYVVFGRAGPFDPDIALSVLNGANGFRIDGAAQFDNAGSAVSSAGDVNGDGINDILIGARRAQPAGSGSGAAYVVFGKNTATQGQFDASLALSALDGTNGFKISGLATYANTGFSAASVGDMNGDGFDDVAVGAPWINGYTGQVYVVFGKAGSFDANISPASLNGANGFVFAEGGLLGESIASGDFNGDGLSDLMVTASQAGSGGGRTPGAVCVLFGSRSGFAAYYTPGSLNGDNGLVIAGERVSPVTGLRAVSAADINGDGYDDLLIGSDYSISGAHLAGYGYVVYGGPGSTAYTGGTGDDTSSGTSFDDTLSGGAGKDTLNGLAGADLIDGGDGNDLLNGGAGADDLIGGLGGDTLNGDDGADELTGGDGADKLYGGTGADLLNGGLGNDRMDGQSDIDTLNGGNGNDYLDGGLGADIMRGGADNDVYIVDDAGDQTIELANEGYDLVRTTLSWILADNIEALELQGATDAAGTGNGGANNLQGNGGNNTLSGLAGNDTINGNDGDDIIIGGQGGDLLRGGTGADIFRVAHVFSGGLETDQIYDFSTAEGDIMDFSGAFAGTIAQVSAFTHTAGEMTLTFASGVTTVKLDIDGNGVAEYWARINGDVTADYGGWLL